MRRSTHADSSTARNYRPSRAPPVAVSVAMAAVPVVAMFVATHSMLAAAFVVTAAVLVVARGRPDR